MSHSPRIQHCLFAVLLVLGMSSLNLARRRLHKGRAQRGLSLSSDRGLKQSRAGTLRAHTVQSYAGKRALSLSPWLNRKLKNNNNRTVQSHLTTLSEEAVVPQTCTSRAQPRMKSPMRQSPAAEAWANVKPKPTSNHATASCAAAEGQLGRTMQPQHP